MDHQELIQTIKNLGKRRLDEKLFAPKKKKKDEENEGGSDQITINPIADIQGNQQR
jgi:hypothetical protein